MGLLDNAKDMLSSATSNINNNYEKGSDGFSGQNDSDRSGGRNQSSGGNLNTDDSRYAKGGGGYDQSANDYNNSSSGGWDLATIVITTTMLGVEPGMIKDVTISVALNPIAM
ncbi:hypothetical protein H4Q26_012329 [Puccinia striiformis f. sp. tritici PST-130]|nr:hypothetical protein H4Q26_012329 [Puccinia striiformis f. sp. tritici PST-130]